MTTDTQEGFIEELGEQAEDLCHIHDHITRIISNLDINDDWFSDYSEPQRANFDLKPVVRMFLYHHARDLDSQSGLARRLRGAAFLHIRFELHKPPQQQLISHSWRNRFDAAELVTAFGGSPPNPRILRRAIRLFQ